MARISPHAKRLQDIVAEHENLRRCVFHQEVIEYALDRIDVAKADGRITVQDHALLQEKYSEKHVRVAQQIETYQKVIRLAELEATKTRLTRAFHEKVHRLTNELGEMKASMGIPQPVSQSKAPTTSQPVSPPVRPPTPRSVSPSRVRIGSTMSTGRDSWSWTSLKGFAVVAIALILLIVSSTYAMGFLTNQQYFSPDASNHTVTTPPNTIDQTTTSSTALTASLELGVYRSQTSMQAVTQIDWGIVYPDDSRAYNLYLVNEGNVPCHLFLNATNWQPAQIREQITVTWDYNGEVVAPDQGINLTVTLTTAANLENVGTFTFDLTITSRASPP